MKDPATGAPIQLRELSFTQLYDLFRSVATRQSLVQAVNDPFVADKLEQFLNALHDPKAIESLIAAHEQRVRWQVRRLYRARCDIVHSAERTVNAALLCANLEFYLKALLTALLAALRDVATLSGPKEFFDRQAHAYRLLLEDLRRGRDERLLDAFSK